MLTKPGVCLESCLQMAGKRWGQGEDTLAAITGSLSVLCKDGCREGGGTRGGPTAQEFRQSTCWLGP